MFRNENNFYCNETFTYLMNVNLGTSATCGMALAEYPCDPEAAEDDTRFISEWMAEYCPVSCGVCPYPGNGIYSLPEVGLNIFDYVQEPDRP